MWSAVGTPDDEPRMPSSLPWPLALAVSSVGQAQASGALSLWPSTVVEWPEPRPDRGIAARRRRRRSLRPCPRTLQPVPVSLAIIDLAHPVRAFALTALMGARDAQAPYRKRCFLSEASSAVARDAGRAGRAQIPDAVQSTCS